ncbi:MAG TPA: elongation factor P [Alphaproteobacteria bacterium]|nr:elongation factor P [Alphaproteobacteria bacterium]
MKVTASNIRLGSLIEHQDKLWRAIKIHHSQKAQGESYLQMDLRNIKNGTKLSERFRWTEIVELVKLDEKPYQFLYTNGTDYTFMDTETYDQITVNKDLIGDGASFLQEGMVVSIQMYDAETVGITLPQTVIMEITEADPVVKGQTASSSYKPAKLVNGVRILVPPHIGSGVKVVVNTSDATYVRVAKDKE